MTLTENIKMFVNHDIQGTSDYNSRLAKPGVPSFYDSEVLNSSSLHLMKFSTENPRLRKVANRCTQF